MSVIGRAMAMEVPVDVSRPSGRASGPAIGLPALSDAHQKSNDAKT